VCGRAAASAAFANWRDRTAPSGSGQVKTHQTIFSINNDNQLGGGASKWRPFPSQMRRSFIDFMPFGQEPQPLQA